MADADVTSPPPFLLLTVLDCSITKRYTVTPPLTLFVSLNPFPSRCQLSLVPSTSQDTPCPDAPPVAHDPEAAFTCTLSAHAFTLHAPALAVCARSNFYLKFSPCVALSHSAAFLKLKFARPRSSFSFMYVFVSTAITERILGHDIVNTRRVK